MPLRLRNAFATIKKANHEGSAYDLRTIEFLLSYNIFLQHYNDANPHLLLLRDF